jgi:Fe-S-cluster-containing hydrogenase component 2
MIGCPTGAIHREPNGQIAITDDTCIGCSTCADSCPYDNIRMVQARNEEGEFLQDEISLKQVMKASKCDLCVDQLDGPACQRACPHDALKRVDFFNLSSLIEEVGQ